MDNCSRESVQQQKKSDSHNYSTVFILKAQTTSKFLYEDRKFSGGWYL